MQAADGKMNKTRIVLSCCKSEKASMEDEALLQRASTSASSRLFIDILNDILNCLISRSIRSLNTLMSLTSNVNEITEAIRFGIYALKPIEPYHKPYLLKLVKYSLFIVKLIDVTLMEEILITILYKQWKIYINPISDKYVNRVMNIALDWFVPKAYFINVNTCNST